MEEKLLEIVSIVLGIDKNNINLNTNREDIEEWDSLNHIRLVAEVEEYFGISIPF